MARSESGSRSFIQAQQQRLMELGEYGDDMPQDDTLSTPPPPVDPPVPVDPAAPTDPSVPPAPPAPPSDVPPPTPPPAEPPPAVPSPQVTDLSQIAAQIEDMRHRLESSEGRLAPIQRQLASALEENEKLKEQLAGQQTARGTQPPASQPPTPPEPDPDLEQFESDGVYGDMTPGLKKLMVQVVKETLGPIQSQIAPVVEMAATQQQAEALRSIRAKHLEPVFEKHPDAYNVVSSPDFRTFINRLPSYVAPSIEQMFLNPEKHPQESLIAVLDDYKRSRNQPPGSPAATPPPAPDPATLSSGPRRIVSVPQPLPTAPVPLTKERVAQINRALTYERVRWTPEQRAALLAELDQGEMTANATGRGAVPTLDTMK